MPATEQDPGGCGCPGTGGCAFTVAGSVNGCRALALAGATVEAHDATAGGTLLGSGTTNSGGNYSFVVSGAIVGHDVVIVAKFTPRMAQSTAALFWELGAPDFGSWDCGASVEMDPIHLSPAAGYHCSQANCALPLKDTLSGTVGGSSATLTYNPATSRWWGSTTKTKDIETGLIVSAAGCCTGCCGTWNMGGSLNVTIWFDGATLWETWSYQGHVDDSGACPQFGYCQQTAAESPTPTFGFVDPVCAAEWGPITQTASAAATPACPPGFFWSGTIADLGFTDGRNPPLAGGSTVTE